MPNSIDDMKRAGYDPFQFSRPYVAPQNAPIPVVPNIPGRSADPSHRDFSEDLVTLKNLEEIPELENSYSNPIDFRITFDKIVEPKIQFVLYNPSDEEVRQNHNGKEYVLPPNNQVYYPGLEPGCCPIFDDQEMLGDKSGKKSFRKIPALDIVRFMVGGDGRSGQLGGRGVRVLTRDGTNVDTFIRKEGRRVYESFKYEACRYLVAAHETRVKNEQAQNTPVTQPSLKIRQAMQFIASYEQRSGEIGPLSPFPCPKCAWPHADVESRNAHIQSLHKEYAATMGLSQTSGNVVSAQEQIEAIKKANAAMIPEKKKRGRPKKVTNAQA